MFTLSLHKDEQQVRYPNRSCGARVWSVVFRQMSSYVKGRLPSKVVFRQRSSSVKGRLPSKVVFRQRSSSVKGRLTSKVVFRQMSSSIKGCLQSKVVFRQRSSSVKTVLRIKQAQMCYKLRPCAFLYFITSQRTDKIYWIFSTHSFFLRTDRPTDQPTFRIIEAPVLTLNPPCTGSTSSLLSLASYKSGWTQP